MKKLLEVLNSSNFKVSIISLLSLVVNYQGVPMESGQEIFDMLNGKSLVELIVPLFVLIYNVGSKLFIKFKLEGFNWGFLRSSNFISQTLSIAALFLSVYIGEPLTGILITLALNLINTFVHISKPAKLS